MNDFLLSRDGKRTSNSVVVTRWPSISIQERKRPVPSLSNERSSTVGVTVLLFTQSRELPDSTCVAVFVASMVTVPSSLWVTSRVFSRTIERLAAPRLSLPSPASS